MGTKGCAILFHGCDLDRAGLQILPMGGLPPFAQVASGVLNSGGWLVPLPTHFSPGEPSQIAMFLCAIAAAMVMNGMEFLASITIVKIVKGKTECMDITAGCANVTKD